MASEKVVLELTTRMKDETKAALRKMRSGIDRFKRHAITAFAAIRGAFMRLRRLFSIGLKIGLVAGGAALFGGGKLIASLVGAASDAEEIGSKFDVVFGSLAEGVRKWADETAKAVNTSRFQLEQYLASMQDLLMPMGFAQNAAAEMSKSVTTLATDLSSFNNIPVDDALLAIRSALIGEREPIRQFGVLINEAAIDAEILASNLMEVAGGSEVQAKALATMNLILAQTTAAQGDATRTAGSFANSLRGYKAAVFDLKVSLGQQLLPAATDVVIKFKEWINQLNESGKLQKVLNGLAEKFGKAWDGFKVFVESGGLQALLDEAKVIWDGFVDDVKKAWGNVVGEGGIFEGIGSTISTMKDDFANAADGMVGSAKLVTLHIQEMVNAVRQFNLNLDLSRLSIASDIGGKLKAGKAAAEARGEPWTRKDFERVRNKHNQELRDRQAELEKERTRIALGKIDAREGIAGAANSSAGRSAFSGAGASAKFGVPGAPPGGPYISSEAQNALNEAALPRRQATQARRDERDMDDPSKPFPPYNRDRYGNPISGGAPVKGISVIIEGIAPQPRDQIAAGRRPAPYLVT